MQGTLESHGEGTGVRAIRPLPPPLDGCAVQGRRRGRVDTGEEGRSDPVAFLAAVRNHAPGRSARESDWVAFLHWLTREQAWLAPRIRSRLKAQGLEARLDPGDVLAAFAGRVFEDPKVLGDAPVPSRSWLWWRVQDTIRTLAAGIRDPADPGRDRASDAFAAPADPEQGPERRAMAAELRRALDVELARLRGESPAMGEALDLVSRHSYSEAAARMGRPEGTVKSLVKRARDLLRARLSRIWSVEDGGSHE